jgi:hypothetical protein
MLFGFIPDSPLDQNNDERFANMAAAQRLSYERQQEAKRERQEKSRLLPLHKRQVQIGDFITINESEPTSLSFLRNHIYKVVNVRGKVISYVPVAKDGDAPGKIQHVNIDRTRVVPEIIPWEKINPRPRRNRTGLDVRKRTSLSLPPSFISDPEPASQLEGRRESADKTDAETNTETAGRAKDTEDTVNTDTQGLRRSERIKRKREEEEGLEPSPKHHKIGLIWHIHVSKSSQ